MLEIEGEICTKKDEKNFRPRLNGRISHRRMLRHLFFSIEKEAKDVREGKRWGEKNESGKKNIAFKKKFFRD